MIHQHIYASPRPGMTEVEFHRYWLEVHAVQYASKIPQIKRYKVCTRVNWKYEMPNPLWSGVAEIWLRNEQEQLASLQTPEFLQGARLDEPRWAAFWNTLVLDCDTHTVTDQIGETAPLDSVKTLVLTKRKPGTSVDDYRQHYLGRRAPLFARVPGILRHDVCFTRDSSYVVGEPRFDGVTHLWFTGLGDVEGLIESDLYRHDLAEEDKRFLDTRYIFPMVVKEHWIIGPEARP